MNSNPIQAHRSSSIVLRLGAMVALIANVASGLLFPDHNSLTAPLQPLYVPLNLPSIIGVGLLPFGLPGWYARHSDELGRRGLVGAVLVAVTLLIAGIFMGLYTAIVMPFAAAEAPALVSPGPVLLPVLLITVVAEIVGPLLVGWDMLRHSVGPRWAAWTMLASAPVTLDEGAGYTRTSASI